MSEGRVRKGVILAKRETDGNKRGRARKKGFTTKERQPCDEVLNPGR